MANWTKKAGTVNRKDLSSKFDVGVHPETNDVVMIYANATGRTAVEEIFPDVEWDTDEGFVAFFPFPTWRYAHVRITRLPDFLEASVPLAFASAESLGFATAQAIQAHVKPRRVFLRTDAGLTCFEGSILADVARGLHGEYVSY
jgi:hypothetical protein